MICTTLRILLGDKIKKDEVEGACDKYGEGDGWKQGFGEED